MIAALAALLLASHPFPSTRPPPINQASVAKYKKECEGKKTPACQALRVEAESALLEDLNILQRAKKKIDPAALSAMAKGAATPSLRIAAMEALAGSGGGELSKEAQAAVINALHSRVPAERRAALQEVDRVPDKKYAQLRARQPKRGRSNFARAVDYVEDELPEVGAPVYPNAEPVWLATGPQRAFFATSDPPAKVIAFYAKEGKKALTRAELEKVAQSAKNIDPSEMMKLAQTDPEKFQKMMEMASSGKAPPGAGADTKVWTEIEQEEGVANARYVVVEDSPWMTARLPSKVVAVFEDKLLGKTGIVFALQPQSQVELPAPGSADYLSAMRLWQIVHREEDPLPSVGEDD